MSRKHKTSFWIWHTLMLSVMVLIFIFSGQQGSASRNVSNGFLELLLGHFSWLIGLGITAWLTAWIRKVAHYTIYLFLGICAVMTYRGAEPEAMGEKKLPFLKGWLTAVCYACTDEFHQLFVPERSGEIKDVCLDSIGAATGVLLVLALVWIINGKKRAVP